MAALNLILWRRFFRPFRALHFPLAVPGLAPGAAFCRRYAAVRGTASGYLTAVIQDLFDAHAYSFQTTSVSNFYLRQTFHHRVRLLQRRRWVLDVVSGQTVFQVLRKDPHCEVCS